MNTPDLQQQIDSLLPDLCRELNLPTLKIVVRPEFAASATSRLKIREAIIASLSSHGKLSDAESQALRMLHHIPNPPHASVSISHTHSIGGFAYTLAHTPGIGFDLEESARVHERAIARVSKPEELERAPSAAQIWVAKEASFKALRGRVPVISSLITGGWRSVLSRENLSLWSCEVREDSTPGAICRGLTVELSDTALGIFAHSN